MSDKSGVTEKKNILCRYVTEKIANDGIENFSMRGLCKDTGISAPRVYELFSCKEEMLESVFLDISREICDVVTSAIGSIPGERGSFRQSEELCWRMWSTFWFFLTSKPEKTLFYFRYLLSSYYTDAVRQRVKTMMSKWNSIIGDIDRRYGISSHTDISILQSNVIRGTIDFAVMSIRGELEEKPNTVSTIFSTVFSPVFWAFGFYKCL